MLRAFGLAGMMLIGGLAPGWGQTSPASPPAANPPVNLDSDGQHQLSPGANSFTEDQARSRLEGDGYKEVSHLVLDRDGIWRGSAAKDGHNYAVGVDFKGTIVAR